MPCCCSKGDTSQDDDIDLKSAINNKKKLCIWILGGPGSGKGTQCAQLASRFNFAHLSTGDLLRNAVNQDTPRANEIRKTMESGALVDTSTVLDLLADAMKEVYSRCSGYLIDGYPREVEQGELFCEQFGAPHVVIHLACSDDVLIERLLKRGKDSGRVDDNLETIKARIKTFHEVSEPVISQWRDQVVEVDGTGTQEEIQERCVQIISKLAG